MRQWARGGEGVFLFPVVGAFNLPEEGIVEHRMDERVLNIIDDEPLFMVVSSVSGEVLGIDLTFEEAVEWVRDDPFVEYVEQTDPA